MPDDETVIGVELRYKGRTDDREYVLPGDDGEILVAGFTDIRVSILDDESVEALERSRNR